jgi:hypothetical protein
MRRHRRAKWHGQAGVMAVSRPFLIRLLPALAVMGVAAFLLLWDLGAVRQPIWDESYYLATTARYHEGRLQFASHPPLGLLLIAAGDGLSGWNAAVDWRGMAGQFSVAARDVPQGFDFAGLRIASALAGVAGAGLFYGLMRQVAGAAEPAMLLSFLYLADPALLVQMRAGHLDGFQIVFALLAMLAALRWLEAKGWRGAWGWAALCGAAVMAAALVRANGALLGVLWPCVALLRRQGAREGSGALAMASLAGLLVLVAVYAAHLAASPLSPDGRTVAGGRDQAFVSAAFAQAPDGLPRLWAAMQDQRAFLAQDLAGMTRVDGNGSHPFGWPLGLGSITYRWDAGEKEVRVLALLPNRGAWWLGLIGLCGGVALVLRGDKVALILLCLWMAQMAALFWLDGQRVLYLYHYFLPLMASYGLLARLWRQFGLAPVAGWVGWGIVLAGFALTAPVALHRASSPAWCRMVAPDCGPFTKRAAIKP